MRLFHAATSANLNQQHCQCSKTHQNIREYRLHRAYYVIYPFVLSGAVGVVEGWVTNLVNISMNRAFQLHTSTRPTWGRFSTPLSGEVTSTCKSRGPGRDQAHFTRLFHRSRARMDAKP